MNIFDNLALGFGVAFTLINLWYCLFGVVLGTLVGVLPGLGPLATIAMLLPVTFTLTPVSAWIMIAGVYYGAQYGGSTTAILVNIPGEASSIITCLDGHAMARQGRAGPALSIAALGSFFAGCMATAIIASFAPPLAEVAIKFGPTEYFSMMVLGLVSAAVLARGSLLKAIGMILLGILFALVGTDVNSGISRFDLGFIELSDGISFVVVAMGLFGFAEIIDNLKKKKKGLILTTKIRGLMPTRVDLKASWKPIVRGTALGSFLGILPGGGALISSFASYALEKRLGIDPSKFGKGEIAGVAGPESANNAGAQASFIPMLTLGIPSNAVMALMLGALLMHGIAPGPQIMTKQPELFWGVIASMWLGNVMLLVINLPLIGIWVRMLKIPYRLLYPAILMFCCIGVYSLRNTSFDIFLAGIFGLLGYIFAELDCEPAPLVMGLILGQMMEEFFLRSMRLSRGDPTAFLTAPISLAMLIAAAILLFLVVTPAIRRKRDEALKEE